METLTFDDIKELVSKTENRQVEFKETTGQLDRGMETLCAFLNGEGGEQFCSELVIKERL